MARKPKCLISIARFGKSVSFLDYFGSNGIAAVENAIGILNNLPPTSQINPSNYPPQATYINYQAQSLGLIDLKSKTLSALIEQLGLASPTRFTFCLYNPSLVIRRNFDLFSLSPSSSVNDTLYSCSADAVEFAVDPLNPIYTAVADGLLHAGEFYAGLTRDDVGGLRYLHRTNNYNIETLLPDVHGTGTNAVSYVNVALRPGVDKVTFVRQQYDSLLGQAVPITNQFTDTYITNGIVMHQQVERVITQPDFLFCSEDVLPASMVVRTGTSNWCNNDALNGSTTTGGPGVIQPPVRITFNRPSQLVRTSDAPPGGPLYVDGNYYWGSFDQSTNAPVVYPLGPLPQSSNQMTVQLWLCGSNITSMGSFTWHAPVPFKGLAEFQTSTNLTDWEMIMLESNNGVPVKWEHWCSRPRRFFRIVPQ